MAQSEKKPQGIHILKIYWFKVYASFLTVSDAKLIYISVKATTGSIIHTIFFSSSLDCGFDVHKKYVHKVEELCVGPSTPSTTSSSVSGVAKKGDKKGLFGIGRILSERDLPSNRKASVQGKNCLTSKQSHYICNNFASKLNHYTIFIASNFVMVVKNNVYCLVRVIRSAIM